MIEQHGSQSLHPIYLLGHIHRHDYDLDSEHQRQSRLRPEVPLRSNDGQSENVRLQSNVNDIFIEIDLSELYRSVLITAVGLVVVKCLSVYTGLIIYAKYHDCDPILTEVSPLLMNHE